MIFAGLFDEASLTPHGFCLAWEPGLIALHVISDSLIALSYYAIPLALAYFVWRRRDLAFRWMFVLFALFILACGTTHLMDVWTLWHPDYLAQGLVKAVTAIVSVLTAIVIWPLLPQAIALPSPGAMRQANAALREQIAEREQAEAMLRQAQKMETLGRLTGGVAHDFNNLLMVIQANLELLETQLDGDTQKLTVLWRAMHGVDRGATLTRQLLAFSRRQSLEPEVIDVNARVTALEGLLRTSFARQCKLEARLDDGPCTVLADPTQLDGALLNLLINARDALESQGLDAQGHVSVSTRAVHLDAAEAEDVPEGDYIAISVADDGPGMSEEVRQAAFDPFFTTKPIGRGSGLGLSQVYGFVRQSKGHVRLTSAPGKGTVVTILLPALASGVG